MKKNPVPRGTRFFIDISFFFEILFVLFYIYASVAEADLDDICSGCGDLDVGAFFVQFTNGKDLTFHVHDGVTFGDVRQGFFHDDFELERPGHSDIESRCVIFAIPGTA